MDRGHAGRHAVRRSAVAGRATRTVGPRDPRLVGDHRATVGRRDGRPRHRLARATTARRSLVADRFAAAAGLVPMGEARRRGSRTVTDGRTVASIARRSAVEADGRCGCCTTSSVAPTDVAAGHRSTRRSPIAATADRPTRSATSAASWSICHGTRRRRARRKRPATRGRRSGKAGGGIGIVTIADPGFAVEPPRWPFAYARTVSSWLDRADTPPIRSCASRSNADALAKTGAGLAGPHDVSRRWSPSGSQGRSPLPELRRRRRVPLRATFTVTPPDRSCRPNVIGLLPGSDASVADQAIVLSAHLDGYGYGTPVARRSPLQRHARRRRLRRVADPPGRATARPAAIRRPILFVAWTGEEKGLLGSGMVRGAPDRGAAEASRPTSTSTSCGRSSRSIC